MNFMENKNLELISSASNTTNTPSISRRRSFELFEKTVSNIKFKGNKVVFVGISGGPASGKTKISQYFHKYIQRSATICELSFYSPNEIKRNINKGDEYLIEDYDIYNKERRLFLIDLCKPNSYDYEKFYETLKNLSEGKKAKIPFFNEEKLAFEPEKDIIIDPVKTPLIIIDGYFIFKEQKIRDLLNLKIFKEVEEDVRLSRLILREEDYLKKDRKAYKFYFDIYEKFYKMSYEENIDIYKKMANILLPDYSINENNQLEGDETLELIRTNLNYLSKR